jgi:hypothetical protein
MILGKRVGAMTYYRFYHLDSEGDITDPPAVGEFADDHSAIQAAEALLDEKAIEVWDGKRVVIRLEPKRK